MTATPLVLVLVLLGQAAPRDRTDGPSKPGDGLEVDGTRVVLPAPSLADGATADEERAALLRIAGSDRAAAELTRDSVTAPFILKTRDVPVAGRGVIRVADLWFVVHARLDDFDPEAAAGVPDGGQTVEAANMTFSARRLGDDELAKRGVKPAGGRGAKEWYVRTTARLLDRIHVESTTRVVATKGDGSWSVASGPATEGEGAGRWYPIVRNGRREEPGAAEDYPGGVGALKASRLDSVPGALLVEAHAAFFEPKGWFDGAPILRSKIGVVAQDRIRALRRALAKSRNGPSRRTVPGRSGVEGANDR